ncbi:Hsp20/alpha crystallin family protein [Aestuariibius sp. 2305UL40-4]|uniref:Hsp20/alpha crystallin family protein n=1 Tax=Aestuariibius violaceus TaxID=3234132 RepID=UPI00345E8F8D
MSKKDKVAAAETPRAEGDTAWSPPAFRAFQDEIDRMFRSLSNPEMNWRSGLARTFGAIGLKVDVGETETDIQITAELPGVLEENLDVTLDSDVLRISAERHQDEESKGKTWHVVERSYGKLERAIRVPAGIDPSQVKADFKDGVLTVTLPKPPELTKAAQKIAVSAG